MDIQGAYAGDTFEGNSDGYSNQLLLIPAFTAPGGNRGFQSPCTAPAPVIATQYRISQLPTGNAIVIAAFDVVAAPAVGGGLFAGAAKPKFVVPITAGGLFWPAMNVPWDRYENGLCLLALTSWTTITLAAACVFFSVRYAQRDIGGQYAV